MEVGIEPCCALRPTGLPGAAPGLIEIEMPDKLNTDILAMVQHMLWKLQLLLISARGAGRMPEGKHCGTRAKLATASTMDLS